MLRFVSALRLPLEYGAEQGRATVHRSAVS